MHRYLNADPTYSCYHCFVQNNEIFEICSVHPNNLLPGSQYENEMARADACCAGMRCRAPIDSQASSSCTCC